MAEKRKVLVIVGRILIVILVIFVILQFIRPATNQATENSPTAIQAHYPVPSDVQQLLKRSCYDCHSNTTVYPWYSYVEPVGWLLSQDIKEGKQELNFDEFASYSAYRQFRRFGAIRQQIEDDKMPLPKYTMIHTASILTPEEKGKIISWVQAMQDTMKSRFPADSLKRPARNLPQ